jgi:hypothetical protein
MGDDDDAVCRTCGDGLAIDDEELDEANDKKKAKADAADEDA